MSQQPAGHLCANCGAALPETAQYCPQCGAKQGGEPGQKPQSSKSQRSASALLGIGVAIAVVVGGISFGITRLVLPEPAALQAEQHQHEEAPAPQQPAATPEQQAQRQQMKDSLIADPNNAGLTIRFANLLYDMGEYESAADFYNRYIIRFDSTNADVYVDYAHTLFRLGKHEEAVQLTKHALTLDPRHQAALFNLGVMSVQMQDREGAINWFKQCAAADSTSQLGQDALKVVQKIQDMSASN